jgi:hypothetical protein
MTGGVANAQEQRLLFTPGYRERFFTPGEPIDRVMGVLQKVRTCFFAKAICEFVFSH